MKEMSYQACHQGLYIPSRRQSQVRALRIWKDSATMEVNYCQFCLSNGVAEVQYKSHTMKNAAGLVSCPVLRMYRCSICQATGDQAHTQRYCPLNRDGKYNGQGASLTDLKKKKNAAGSVLLLLEVGERGSLAIVFSVPVEGAVPLGVGLVPGSLTDGAPVHPQHGAAHQAGSVLHGVSLVLNLGLAVGETELAVIYFHSGWILEDAESTNLTWTARRDVKSLMSGLI